MVNLRIQESRIYWLAKL